MCVLMYADIMCIISWHYRFVHAIKINICTLIEEIPSQKSYIIIVELSNTVYNSFFVLLSLVQVKNG